MIKKLKKLLFGEEVIKLNLKEVDDKHFFNGKYLIVLDEDKQIVYREGY